MAGGRKLLLLSLLFGLKAQGDHWLLQDMSLFGFVGNNHNLHVLLGGSFIFSFASSVPWLLIVLGSTPSLPLAPRSSPAADLTFRCRIDEVHDIVHHHFLGTFNAQIF